MKSKNWDLIMGEGREDFGAETRIIRVAAKYGDVKKKRTWGISNEA